MGLETLGRRRLSAAVPKSGTTERHIYVNTPLPADALDPHGRPTMTYPSNEVVTSKYSLLSFLPKNLFEQFRRLANVFFLVLIILQTFPEFITVDPMVAAAPTIIIVAVTAMKDGFEDMKRHNTDNQVNNCMTYSLPRWGNVNYVSPTRQKRWAAYYWFRQVVLGMKDDEADDQELVGPDAAARGGNVRVGHVAKGGAVASQSPEPAAKVAGADEAVMTTVKLKGGDDQGDGDQDMDQDVEGKNAGLEKTEVTTSLGNLSIRDPCALEDAWSPVKWRDLKVGDFVLLRNNEFIPADIVIVSTSEPDSVCYVETKNLDGETNLKVHKGMAETAHIRHPEQCRNLKLVVNAEAPSNNMFTFNGAVTITDLGSVTDLSDRMPCKIPITMNGVLLRGCVLRNTSWAIGLVAYTGNQTKLRLNAGETPSKRSIIERLMNPQIVINLLLMAAICLVCAVGGIFWSRNAVKVRAPYLPLGSESGYDIGYAAFLAFWSALIAFQNIVPISLYLTVEIVKTLQAYLIYSDIQMYYEHLDLPCVPKSWNLADDLGQIEYVFSDKTGTLTRNVMEFRRCSINGVVYGAPLLTSQSPTKSAAAAAQFTPPADYTPRSLYGSPTPKFYDALMSQDLDVDNDHARMVCEFWRLIGICHTVLVSKPDPAQPYHITYKAQSPDEAALVEASKELGFTFIGRHMTDIFMDVMGVEEQYTLLAVLEFNSTRKRMSIVARRPDGAIVLYCKGADSVIFERLGSNTSQLVQECTLKHLELFADEGLRTLCLAYRVIPTDEFYEWVTDYNEACAAIHDREDKIDTTAERIERDLVLLGATAIEDQLQEGVPECIQTLRDAGIKVWVLTGDKMETAISIGFSCNLLAKNLNLIVIKGGPDDPAAVMNQIKEAKSTFFTNRAAMANGLTNGMTGCEKLKGSVDIHPSEAVIGCSEHALVIDGAALKVALEPNNKGELLSLGSRCKVVMCCRVSPLQKAQVVSLVKDGLNAVTLAIGDGANDVSMIQAAHIGIGIAGEEGLQAVMASDYAIAQFRYLSRLLLMHGRWSYHRISELIYNYFYKDIIFVFVIFWFQFYAGFSTQAPYEFTYMLFYNLFFTNWPVMVLGIFDQDVPESMATQIPKLYQSGIKQTLYTKSRFWLYMFDGVFQSLVCFFIPMGIYYECQSTGHLGYAPDIFELGTTMAAASITCANLYVALNTRRWIWFNHFATWIASIGVFYAYLVVYFNVDSPVRGLSDILWSSPLFWFGTLLSVTVSMLPRYLYEYARRTYSPTDVDIANEVHKFKLDIQPLLPEPVVIEEPPPPPSAHPDRLSIIIPSPRNASGSYTGSQLELVPTPAILQFATEHLMMGNGEANPASSATTASPPAGSGADNSSSSSSGLTTDSSSPRRMSTSTTSSARQSARLSGSHSGSKSGSGELGQSVAVAPTSDPSLSSSHAPAPVSHHPSRLTIDTTGSGHHQPPPASTPAGAVTNRISSASSITRPLAMGPGHRRSVTLSTTFNQPAGITGTHSGSLMASANSPTKPSGAPITVMRSMTVTRNRGFSFSTDETGGMRNILMCEYVPTPGSPTSLGMAVQAQKIVSEQKGKSTVSDWELYRGGAGGGEMGSNGQLSASGGASAKAGGAAGKKFAMHLQALPESTLNREGAPKSAPLEGPDPSAKVLAEGGDHRLGVQRVPLAGGPGAGPAGGGKRAAGGRGHGRAASTSVLPRNAGSALSDQYGINIDPRSGRMVHANAAAGSPAPAAQPSAPPKTAATTTAPPVVTTAAPSSGAADASAPLASIPLPASPMSPTSDSHIPRSPTDGVGSGRSKQQRHRRTESRPSALRNEITRADSQDSGAPQRGEQQSGLSLSQEQLQSESGSAHSGGSQYGSVSNLAVTTATTGSGEAASGGTPLSPVLESPVIPQPSPVNQSGVQIHVVPSSPEVADGGKGGDEPTKKDGD